MGVKNFRKAIDGRFIIGMFHFNSKPVGTISMNLRTIPSDQLAPLAKSIIEEMYRRLGGNFDANTDEVLTGAIDAIGEAGSAFEAERSFQNGEAA